MNSFICNNCNKSFSSKSNLTAHIKKAKYCANLTKDISERDTIINYECNKCLKTFTSNQTRNKHQDKCKYINDSVVEILKNQLNEINQQNRDLQNNLNKLADKAVSKPTSIVNNNNKDNKIVNQYNHVQSLDLSKEHLEKVINENMRFKHVCKGRKGFVDLVSNNILKDENGKSLAWCPDYTRKMVKYKDTDGDIVTDPKAYNIITSVAPLVEKKIREVKQLFEKTYYTTDEEEFVEEYTETESEYSDGGRRWVSLKKVRRRIFSNINKIWNDIKDYKSKYNIDKVNFYFDKIIHSIDNIIEVCENFDKVSHELTTTLPNKPPKRGISIEE